MCMARRPANPTPPDALTARTTAALGPPPIHCQTQVSLQTVKEAVGGVREVHFVLFMKEVSHAYRAVHQYACAHVRERQRVTL